jgi:hypothetical protein
MRGVIIVLMAFSLSACGTLEKKASMVNAGASKADVMGALGEPDDRQMRGNLEAWQYCQTGAGFGYHDYRIVWFQDGRVTGLNSYKSTRPGASCRTDLREVRWEDAPNMTIEVRNR